MRLRSGCLATLFALLALPLLSMCYPAYAFDVALTGAEITLAYTEPSTNVNDTPLLDLKETRGYFQQSGGTPQLGVTVPASSPTGGQAIMARITVPILQDQEADVNFWVTAADLSNNESPQSVKLLRRIDRLAPKSPQ
jgi:hypothetical protein